MTNKENISVDLILPYANNPYKVSVGRKLDALVESIREQGILTPLIVRPMANGKYELVSGHRRLAACRKLGIKTVPVTIKELTDDEAAIVVVDANLQRDHILPSEKAYAFKLKMEALNHQGRTCGQVGHKSRDAISESESGRQVQRYIRLTYLIPELLNLVDRGSIAVSAGVSLSYLTLAEQQWVLNEINSTGHAPTVKQAQALKSSAGALTQEYIGGFLAQEKHLREDALCIPRHLLQDKVPEGSNDDQLVKYILDALDVCYNLMT